MKKPEFRPLAKEDFPEAPWIEKLLRPLNTVLGQIAAGLGGGITIAENLSAEVRTFDVTPSALPLKFTTKVRGKVAGVVVFRCVEVVGRDERNVADPVFPGWSQDGASLSLNSVSGLTGGRSYRLTVAVFGG